MTEVQGLLKEFARIFDEAAREITVCKATVLVVSTEICPGHVAILFEGAPHVLLEYADALELANMIKNTPVIDAPADLAIGATVKAKASIADA